MRGSSIIRYDGMAHTAEPGTKPMKPKAEPKHQWDKRPDVAAICLECTKEKCSGGCRTYYKKLNEIKRKVKAEERKSK